MTIISQYHQFIPYSWCPLYSCYSVAPNHNISAKVKKSDILLNFMVFHVAFSHFLLRRSWVMMLWHMLCGDKGAMIAGKQFWDAGFEWTQTFFSPLMQSVRARNVICWLHQIQKTDCVTGVFVMSPSSSPFDAFGLFTHSFFWSHTHTNAHTHTL